MSVQDEFNAIPEELKAKVVKKINKMYRWFGHSGGLNEVTFYALNTIVFKAYEDMGYNITVTPQANVNDSGRIFLTDK